MNMILNSPNLVGMITLLLMWIDWTLTHIQERERIRFYHKHYESYPVNTIEGNPMIRAAVHGRQLFNPLYVGVTVISSIVVAITSTWLLPTNRELFLGWVWGVFLLVSTTHLSNTLGYLACRNGIEGKIRMHLRTGYLIQAGRNIALTPLMIILWLVTGSNFVLGVVVASVASAIRHLLWIQKIPDAA